MKKKQKDILKWHIPFVANYQKLGEQYILSANVHMDETTPHMHIVFIPVVHKLDKKSGKMIDKIACSEFWKGKESYKILQDKFYKCVKENGFELERGKQIGNEHLSVEKYKEITKYNQIKEELNTTPIKELETKNTALVVAQNKQLIEYNKKLKQHLLKSYKAIEDNIKLKEENIILIQENETLKKKNKMLLNYIEKTFEVVKHLFDFPVNKFKSIVDNFVNSLNK